jgi:Protein of unknown function (DUF1360)
MGVGDDGFAARFTVGAFATWRVTHLLAAEDGPGEVVVKLRRRVGESWLGELMDCFYCVGVWTAAPAAAAVARRLREMPLTWLALSGAACLLERVTREKGDVDVLWEEAEAGAESGGAADAREPDRGDLAYTAAETPR